MATEQQALGTVTPVLKISAFQRGDVAFALGLIAILAVLILPVHSMVLDMALAISITFSVLILMTALFIERPLEFSVFPTVLLVSTMIRLALNVASTRLILTDGHQGTHAAGKVIQAFGHFIMGGNFVIGLIVFAILVIVNFVVITKGSGRIAEVSARFSLDAMPGKQMAIDADLSAGLISEAEAKKRRKTLEEESNFFGAMDGSAKFVRGDAIAAILITFINIVGGIVIGVVQNDMSLLDATRTYTVLSVGDGLVSQVPALIVSTAAGMLVSKAGIEGTADKAMFSQLSAYPTALGISSFLTGFMAIIPSMPMMPFLVLSIITGVSAWRISQENEKKKQEAFQISESEAVQAAQPLEESPAAALAMDSIRIELGYALLGMLNSEHGRKITDQIKNLRKQLAGEIGFILPSVRIQDNLQLGAMTYVIKVKELEAGRGELRLGQYLVLDPQGQQIPLDGEDTHEPTFGLPAKWIDESKKEQADVRGYTVVDASTVLTTHLTELVKDNMAELLSFAEVFKMLDGLGESYRKLLNDIVPSQITIGGIQRVLQNLVSERVSIRDLTTILEGIAEACTYTRNVTLITEHVRGRLSRQISFANADDNGVLSALNLSGTWEQILNEALVGEGEVKQLSLSPAQLQDFIGRTKNNFDRFSAIGKHVVLVTSAQIRPYIRTILERVRPSMIVMSQTEVHPKVKVQNMGAI